MNRTMIFDYNVNKNYSVIRLASPRQATGPYCTPIIECTHGLVPTISWNAHMEILHYILFNKGLPCLFSLTLSNCLRVDVGFRQESTIPRNVCGGLGGADCEFMSLVLKFIRIWIDAIGRLRAIDAVGALSLCYKESALASIGLSRKRPFWALGLRCGLRESLLDYTLVCGFPVRGGIRSLLR